MYNGTVTKISSCQVYEISRKELNRQQVLLFLFPFVSHESTKLEIMLIVTRGNPQPLALNDRPARNY